MKIKNANAGALTNFEVLDFLRSRGASKDASRVIAPVAPSEYKVYDYLVGTPAFSQTREQINEFLEKSKKYDLAKAEILNIINIIPFQLVEIDPIIEKAEMRLGDQEEELLELVQEVFPTHHDSKIDGNKCETGNRDKNDADNNKAADAGCIHED